MLIVIVITLLLLLLVYTMSDNLYETYRSDICVLDTSLIHDEWVKEHFRIQRFKKCSHVYGDTITMKKLEEYEISYISPHKRIVTLFSRNDSNETLVIGLSDYVEKNQLSVVDVWVRTTVEMDIAKVIFASTRPDINTNIRYTTNPLSKTGVYCFLIDLRDQILEYARTTPVTLLTYDTMDTMKSLYFIPYHETSMVDVASIFGIKSTDGKRALCMSFTYCMWSLVSLNYVLPVKQGDGIDKVGFFDQYFKVSKKLISLAEQMYSTRGNESRPLKKKKNGNTLLFKENEYMIINAKQPLPKGYVWVSKGDDVYENAFPVYMSDTLESTKIDEDKTIVTFEKVPVSYYMVYFKDLKKMCQITKRDDNNVAHVLIRQSDVDKNIHLTKYRCVTNDKYEFDFQCKEENGDVWDRPCMNDFECPFYNMDLDKGGCKTDGFCELPVGVKNIGFRRYDKETKPFCHTCPDRINDPYCCNDDGNYYFHQ
jgi:hypothetical protein